MTLCMSAYKQSEQQNDAEVKNYLQDMVSMMTTKDQEQNKKNTRLIAQLMHKQLKEALTQIKEEDPQDPVQSDSDATSSSYTSSSAASRSLKLQPRKSAAVTTMQAIPETADDEDSVDENYFQPHIPTYRKMNTRQRNERDASKLDSQILKGGNQISI